MCHPAGVDKTLMSSRPGICRPRWRNSPQTTCAGDAGGGWGGGGRGSLILATWTGFRDLQKNRRPLNLGPRRMDAGLGISGGAAPASFRRHFRPGSSSGIARNLSPPPKRFTTDPPDPVSRLRPGAPAPPAGNRGQGPTFWRPASDSSASGTGFCTCGTAWR